MDKRRVPHVFLLLCCRQGWSVGLTFASINLAWWLLLALQVEPNWCLDGFFVVYQHQPALEYDQVPRDSMSRTVSTPEEINGIPWRLSHSKSSAVLRMLHDYIGENVFKNALFHYISKYKWVVLSKLCNQLCDRWIFAQEIRICFQNCLSASSFWENKC